ncbi:MAG: hypothetical protein ABL921_02355 [Pirellula sp.]
MTFVFITYVPLQVAAVWAVKHPIARLAALLPIVPMIRVILVGMQPYAYNGGSLYGIMLMFVQVPAMLYLATFILAGLTRRYLTSKPKPEVEPEDKAPMSSSTAISKGRTRD